MVAVALVAGFNAMFPAFAFLGRWPTRLGVRGTVVYLVARAAVVAAVELVRRVNPR